MTPEEKAQAQKEEFIRLLKQMTPEQREGLKQFMREATEQTVKDLAQEHMITIGGSGK